MGKNGTDAPKIIQFEGSELRHLNPDERNAGSPIQKALAKKVEEGETMSMPGVYVRKGGLMDIIVSKEELIYLHQDRGGGAIGRGGCGAGFGSPHSLTRNTTALS